MPFWTPSDVAALAGERPLLRLWSRKVQLALGAKDVAVEACNPTTPARRDVEIADGGLDMWRDAVPIKLRIFIHEVRRRFIPELLVQTTLFKFVVKGVGFSQIMRVTKLTDEIGGAQQRPFFVDAVVGPGWGGEAREFDRAGDPWTVELVDLRNTFQHEQLRPIDVIRGKRGVGASARQGNLVAGGIDNVAVASVPFDDGTDVADIMGQARDDEVGIVGRCRRQQQRAALEDVVAGQGDQHRMFNVVIKGGAVPDGFKRQ